MADISFTIKNYPTTGSSKNYTVSEGTTWKKWCRSLISTSTPENPAWKYKSNTIHFTDQNKTWFFGTDVESSTGPVDSKIYSSILVELNTNIRGTTVLGGGGGGSGSDDVTASSAHVLQYIPGTTTECTAITTDSDDDPIQGTIPIFNWV